MLRHDNYLLLFAETANNNKKYIILLVSMSFVNCIICDAHLGCFLGLVKAVCLGLPIVIVWKILIDQLHYNMCINVVGCPQRRL